MARKRKILEEPILNPETGDIETRPGAEQMEDARKRKRIVIPIREDGLDLSRLSDEDIGAIRQAVATSDGPPTIDPMLVAMILDGVASLEATVLSVKFRLPADQVRRVLIPQEPIRTPLSETTARVISKHNLMGRWADEVALLSLLTVWQAQSLATIKQLALEAEAEAARKKSVTMEEEGTKNDNM